MKDCSMSLEIKLRELKAFVIPTVLHESECWILEKEKDRLRTFEMYCLRIILNIRWEQRITNVRVRELTEWRQGIVERVLDNQKKWFGHAERMEAGRWPRKMMYSRMHGNRPTGRPKQPGGSNFKEQTQRSRPGR